ncbi:MAG: hypothetical protein GXY42_12130 [Desulfovibrionales bacterium]|nr:hypothetical protein [Desulfovibrionales bacterium]
MPHMKITMPILSEDEQVRGGVYLCQVGNRISCGSCCGLYNLRGVTREGLRQLLLQRAAEFAKVPRKIDAILGFALDRSVLEGQDHPVPEFHHCVFAGMITNDGERIGCMLHPLAAGNCGVDWRGLSFYGGAACRLYFCPTYAELEPRWKLLVRAGLEDWFEYGLIIPEHRFIAAALGALEARLQRTIGLSVLSDHSLTAVARLLRTRLDWPFRNPDAPLAWNFFSTRLTDRPECDAGPSIDPLIGRMLRELDTLPKHAREAAMLLEELLARTASAIGK